MKHNLIADIVKPWWFLKIIWADFLVKEFALFYVRIVNRHHHGQIVCMSYFYKMILFTGLLCDNSNSLTYKPRKGQSPTLLSGNYVTRGVNVFPQCIAIQTSISTFSWLYISYRLAFHSNNSNLDVWRPLYFCNKCLKWRLFSFKNQQFRTLLESQFR